MTKRKLIAYIKWLPVIALFLLGIWLYGFTSGRSFLGLILCGIAGVICCYQLLAIAQKRQKKAAIPLQWILTWLLTVGIAIYALTLVPIFRAAGGNGGSECQYIVVLGAKVNATAPSRTLRDRIYAAYDYLTAYPDTIAILSGGKGADEGISEAQCMFNELTKMGISPHRLWLEEQATSTRENINFSLALIEDKTGSRPENLGILSSEYHLYRARRVAKEECGVIATMIPAETSRFTIKLNYYLREVAAVWYYFLLGG